MDYQQKMLLVCGLLIAAVLYFATMNGDIATPDTKDAQALLMRSLSFGMGTSDYTYSYTEISDGYKNSYTLVKNGNTSYLELQNPLSRKKAYFSDNDTDLCIRYTVNETCDSVAGMSALDNYIAFLRSRFFNDDVIERDKNNMKYLLEHKFVDLDGDIIQSSSNGRPCSRISYSINMTNLTLDEAARFGISSNSPRQFNWSMCIDNQSGLPYEKGFNYTYNGTAHTYQYTLSAFKESGTAIAAPQELVPGILDILYKEREQQIKLASCYTDLQGEDRERCIAVIALDIRRKDICDLAGGRRDRCLVSLVPVTKDAAICPTIKDQSFRDDCYIELGGAYKDNSYCGHITDASKKETCMDVSQPAPAKPQPEPANQTSKPANDTSGFDPEKFMEEVDKIGGNSTAVNATNASG
jgi:hypothetical protein